MAMTQPLRENAMNDDATRVSWQWEVLEIADLLGRRQISRALAAKRLWAITGAREGE